MVTQPAKKPVPYGVPTLEEIYALGETCSAQDKALLYFLYLSGARISEALAVKKRDISARQLPTGDIATVITVTTLKTDLAKGVNTARIREIPIGKHQLESAMLKDIETWLLPIALDERIFSFTRQYAWQVLHSKTVSVQAYDPLTKELVVLNEFRVHPHFLRHCRLTHLYQLYGLSAVDIMKYAGWVKPTMADRYIHSNWQDIYKKMG